MLMMDSSEKIHGCQIDAQNLRHYLPSANSIARIAQHSNFADDIQSSPRRSTAHQILTTATMGDHGGQKDSLKGEYMRTGRIP